MPDLIRRVLSIFASIAAITCRLRKSECVWGPRKPFHLPDLNAFVVGDGLLKLMTESIKKAVHVIGRFQVGRH